MNFGVGNPAYGIGLLQSFDKFGLPSNLDLLSDTQLKRLEADVYNLIDELYTVAVKRLGEERARDAYQRTALRKRGRPSGSANPERDQWLLDQYDTFVSGKGTNEIKSAPREVATIAKDEASDWFPAEVPSVEHHLRGLLKVRERERAAKAAEQERIDAMISEALFRAAKATPEQ
jgi:hypothetical protein